MQLVYLYEGWFEAKHNNSNIFLDYFDTFFETKLYDGFVLFVEIYYYFFIIKD